MLNKRLMILLAIVPLLLTLGFTKSRLKAQFRSERALVLETTTSQETETNDVPVSNVEGTNTLPLASAGDVPFHEIEPIYVIPPPGYFTLGNVQPCTYTNVQGEMEHLNNLLIYHNTGLPPSAHNHHYALTPGVGGNSGVPPGALPLATRWFEGGPFNKEKPHITVKVSGFTYLSVKWGPDVAFYYVRGNGEVVVENSVNKQGAIGFNLFNPEPPRPRPEIAAIDVVKPKPDITPSSGTRTPAARQPFTQLTTRWAPEVIAYEVPAGGGEAVEKNPNAKTHPVHLSSTTHSVPDGGPTLLLLWLGLVTLGLVRRSLR
jgi:hypothetical protein